MKSTGQKLKKLKTRQVYGFRKDQLYGGFNNGDPTTLTLTTTTHLALNVAV
jgi:hypothetical protein